MDMFLLAEWLRVRANASWGDTPRSKHIYFPGKIAESRRIGYGVFPVGTPKMASSSPRGQR